jgi:hypothetical protein
MDLHKFIAETRKITEGDLYKESEEGQEIAPVEGEIEQAEAPEVTEELVATLSNDNPELKDVDQGELMKGLQTELSHFDTVGGDINTIAGLAMDNLRKYPGQKYYSALEQLQTELGQAEEQAGAPAPSEEPAVEEPLEQEPPVDTTAPVEEPAAFEAKVSEENTTASSKDEVSNVSKSEDLEDKLTKEIKAQNKTIDKVAAKPVQTA